MSADRVVTASEPADRATVQGRALVSAVLLWTRADIRRSWGSLVVVSLLVAVAGGVVTAGIDGARRAASSVDRFVETSGTADVTIYTDGRLDENVRDRLVADPRIEQYTAGTLLTVTPTAVRPGVGGGTFVTPIGTLGGARSPILVEGRYPSGPGEVALSTQSARDLGLSVGDEFPIHAVSFADCYSRPDCEPIPAGTARLAGTLHTDQEFVVDPSGWVTMFAVDDLVSDDIARDAAFGHLGSAWTTPDVNAEQVVADYAPLIDNGDIATDTNTSGALGPAFRAVGYEHDAVLLASLIAAVASVLIVGQAHGRYLARRRSDVPALLSLGMTRPQRAASAWTPGIVAALFGAGLAVPIAIALSPAFPLRTARAADPALGVHADWSVLAGGAAMTFALAALAALLSAWRWSARPVAGATKDVTTGARTAQVLQLGPMPTMGTRFALERSIGQQRLPSVAAMLATIAAVLIATAATVIGINVTNTLDRPTSYGVTWDLTAGAGPDLDAARDYARADDRLDSAYLIQPGELDVAAGGGGQVVAPVVGIEAIRGPLRLTMLDGRPPAHDGEVALTRSGRRVFGAGVGDTLSLSGSGARDVEVVGMVVVPNEGLGSRAQLVTTLSLLDELDGQAGIAEIDAGATVLLTASDPSDTEAIIADLEAAGASPELPPKPAEVSLLDEIRFVPYAVAGFIVVLAVFSTFHALWTTNRRRRSELMTLRAVGARPREVARIPRWQALVVSLVGITVGVPLGIATGRRIWIAAATERDLAPVVDVSWLAIGAIATTTAAGVILLAGIPASTVARCQPARELRSE